jgi:hypothetical protein
MVFFVGLATGRKMPADAEVLVRERRERFADLRPRPQQLAGRLHCDHWGKVVFVSA